MQFIFKIWPLFFISFILFSQPADAQKDTAHLYYRHLTVQDGLPSNEVYLAYQDKMGYIWICTDNGVSKFDGVSFQNFGVEEGLSSNVVFGCKEDQNNTLWVYSFSGELSKYDPRQNRFEESEYNDSLVALLAGRVIQNLFFDRDTIYVVTASSYVTISKNSKGVASFKIKIAGPETLTTRLLSTGAAITIMSIGKKENTTFTFVLEGSSTNHTIGELKAEGDVGQHISSLIDDELHVLFGENFFRYNFRTQECNISRLPFSHIPILSKSNIGLLSGSFGKGLWCFNKRGSGISYENLLQNVNISGTMQDRQGAIWACSQTDGIFYFPTTGTYSFFKDETSSTERITSLFLRGDTSIYLNYGGALYSVYLKNRPEREKLTILNAGVRKIRSVVGDKVFFSGLSHYWYNFKTKSVNKGQVDDFICGLSTSEDLSSFMISGERLYWQTCIGGSFETRIVHEHWKYGRIFTKAVSKKGKLWLATTQDLIFIDTVSHELKELGRNAGLQDLFVHEIHQIGVDSFIVASNKGILLVVHDSVYRRITTEHGLSSNKVLCLFSEQSLVWAGTSRGIDLIVGFIGNSPFSVRSISGLVGLPALPVLKLSSAKEYIVAGSDQGLLMLNRKHLLSQVEDLRTWIKSVLINDSILLTEFPVQTELPHDQNTILISFTSFNFKNSFFNTFRYRLKNPNHNSWTTTNENRVFFSALSPGKYVFELEAMNPDGTWSKNSSAFHFTILNPYWFTWWFLSATSLCAGLFILLIFRIRLRQVRQIAELRGNLAEAKIMALGMQLNPHFVFNALNSVTFHLARNDAKTSLKFLGKFAKLMRIIFKNSQSATISLEEELKALELYFELEKVRLGTGFTHEIKIEKTISINESRIPSLLLQPLVENAIWHGIGQMKSGGHIVITITQDKNILRIEITDNGIGRINSRRIKPPGDKQSHSLDVIKERLRLLTTKYNSESFLKISNVQESRECPGTRVLLVLPRITNSEN